MTPSEQKAIRVLSRSAQILGLLAGLTTVFGLWLTFKAPLDSLQGLPQKIFYIHVGFAWTAYMLVGILALLALVNLARPQSDLIAHGAAAAAESSWVFLTGVIITGPIWAKPIWGTWWSWDARLTATFVLWLSLAVYNLLRANLPNDSRSSRMLAVLALISAADVPVIHFSVKWWRTLHPDPVIMQEKIGGGLDPTMLPAFLTMLLAVSLWGLALWALATSIRYYHHLCLQEDA